MAVSENGIFMLCFYVNSRLMSTEYMIVFVHGILGLFQLLQ